MAREMKSQTGGGAGETEALKKCQQIRPLRSIKVNTPCAQPKSVCPPSWQNALAGTRTRDPQGAGRGGPDNQARFLERKRPPVPVPPFMATPTSGGNTPCAQPARREPPSFGPNKSGGGAGRVDTERGDHKIAGDRVESGRGHGGSSESNRQLQLGPPLRGRRNVAAHAHPRAKSSSGGPTRKIPAAFL